MVEYHEMYVSNTTFADIYKQNENWKLKYFSPEGSGRSYSELHEAYRIEILQKYFNISLVCSSVVFLVAIMARYNRIDSKPSQEQGGEPAEYISKKKSDAS